MIHDGATRDEQCLQIGHFSQFKDDLTHLYTYFGTYESELGEIKLNLPTMLISGYPVTQYLLF